MAMTEIAWLNAWSYNGDKGPKLVLVSLFDKVLIFLMHLQKDTKKGQYTDVNKQD